LLVVIEPSMTETAELADWVLPTPCGYEKWETAGFPKGYPEIYVQLRPPVIPALDEGLPEPEIYARLAEAMNLITEPPPELFDLAKDALTPEGAAAYFAAASGAAKGHTPAMLFWGYRTLGPLLPAPSLISIWVNALENSFARRDSVLRTLGADWADKGPFDLGVELFRRILEHPEGVEIAKAELHADNLKTHTGWEDGRIRLAPKEMLAEIKRAIDTPPRTDPDYPFVLGSGLRTRWNANTIQRDPDWRKGRGPHCALNISPGDAAKLGLASGDIARVSTRRGSVELPAAIDKKLQDGHVWIPNGFGMRYPSGPNGELEMQGVNLNELSDAALRDPITGCPEHKMTPCQIERV